MSNAPFERLRVCPRCYQAKPLDHRCGGPPPASPARERERIRRKRKRKGYDSRHWLKLSARAIARDRACRICGRMDDLTAHLLAGRGEDHTRAKLADVVVLCRVCHGRIDGQLGGGRR